MSIVEIYYLDSAQSMIQGVYRSREDSKVIFDSFACTNERDMVAWLERVKVDHLEKFGCEPTLDDETGNFKEA